MKFWYGNAEQRLQLFQTAGCKREILEISHTKDNWDLHGGHGTRNCLIIHGNLVTKC
jgi:hypothetical protein